MVCPHCHSPELRKLNRRTELGYEVFCCGDCGRKSNERTGTPFNYLEFPTDIVFEIVLSRLLYKLSLRNLAQMSLLRGFEFTHEAVRDWEERLPPLLAEGFIANFHADTNCLDRCDVPMRCLQAVIPNSSAMKCA